MADAPRSSDSAFSANDMLSLTAQIVASHVANNAVEPAALPALIHDVFRALSQVGRAPAPAPVEKKPAPQAAVPWKKSVFPDYIVCLEDGKKLKMLKRHLKTAYDLTPKPIASAGACRRTIRWWRRTTPTTGPASRKRAAWAHAAAAEAPRALAKITAASDMNVWRVPYWVRRCCLARLEEALF